MTNGGSALSNVTNLLRVHVCVCMCVHVRTYECVHVCMHLCVRVCVCKYMRARACMRDHQTRKTKSHTHKKSTWQAQTVLFAKQCEFVFIMKQ